MNTSITIFFDEKDKDNVLSNIDKITAEYEWFHLKPMPFFLKYINKHFLHAYFNTLENDKS